jgi:hypothetical protein
MSDPVAARNRFAAAEGILADFDKACMQPRPDWQSWANRLAGTLRQITAQARETQALNRQMAEIFEDILRDHRKKKAS